jgi:hypothetical protein
LNKAISLDGNSGKWFRGNMNEGGSLINLGELSKPATVLIEKIAEATGGVFRPFQIRRVAQAEADAEIIKTSAKIEIRVHSKRIWKNYQKTFFSP